MPGGLLQLTTYGSQDLFLTGTPEITFFKVVYRRHTSFSMESMIIDFDDPTEFNNISNVKIPKIGDLMHKTYVEIKLPEINLYRDPGPIKSNIKCANDQLTVDTNNYQIVVDFMSINVHAYTQANEFYVSENSDETAIVDMVNIITSIFNMPCNLFKVSFSSLFRIRRVKCITLNPQH